LGKIELSRGQRRHKQGEQLDRRRLDPYNHFIMELDFATVDGLRRNHPAWRLLAAEHAALIISFLNRVYLKPNIRGLEQARLVSLLEDELFSLRELRGEDAFPRSASDYLDDWAQDQKGWLRKYYPAGSDDPNFDLTPGAEKAIAWAQSLGGRSFVGTESRLRLVFDLLSELVEGSGVDADAAIKELKRQKAELDRRIARLRAGEKDLLDETAARERFLHMASTAREILSDFREVEQNFRDLDRKVRESIAAWEGSKGELVGSILGRRDAIAESDQGKSFQAFWDFLMSAERQESLGAMLETALELPAVKNLAPDPALRRVHFDWMEAGERTQRTVALLSSQLRRFLDDQVWMENRRIMEILRSIEAKALELRGDQPTGPMTELDSPAADIQLTMERPLYNPPLAAKLDSSDVTEGDEEVDAQALFAQWTVDLGELRTRVEFFVEERGQASLASVIEANPLERGLAELVGYLSVASADPCAAFSDTELERVEWDARTEPGPAGGDRPERIRRAADLPQIIFARSKKT